MADPPRSELPEVQPQLRGAPIRLVVVFAALTVVCWMLVILGVLGDGPSPWLAAALATLLTLGVHGRLRRPTSRSTTYVRRVMTVLVVLLLGWLGVAVYVAITMFD